MPIYMIMSRYSHNYALFYQLLDSNLFTHRNTYAILREALVKPMAPGSIFHHINLPSTSYFCRHLFCNLYFPIYTTKIPKIFSLLSLLDLTFASDHDGIDNPFIMLGPSCRLFVQVFSDLCIVSYWIDTFVLKTEGNTYATLLHHPLLFGEIQRSAQEVARRISGAVAGEVRASQHTKYPSQSLSLALHYLSLVFLSPTLPFYSPSLSQSPPLFPVCLFSLPCCLLVC